MTEGLQALTKLFGERTVFLPCAFGEKKPIDDGWQRTTFEQTEDPIYQSNLDAVFKRGGNLGIVVGPASGDLVAQDIDEDSLVDEFLELNPRLRETTQTRGARGCQIWMRMVGKYPKRIIKQKLPDGGKFGEWRGGGGQSIVWGRHPSGKDYRIEVKHQPITIAWNDIKWPEYLKKEVKPRSEPSTPTATADTILDLGKRISAYIATIPGAISGHDGHGQTFKAACALVNGFGLSIDEAWPYMETYNQRCEPPWSEKELRHKLESADKVAQSKGYLVNGNRPFSERMCSPGEIGEIGETASSYEGDSVEISPIKWAESGENSPSLPSENRDNSPISPISTAYTLKAIYPPDSILADFFNFAVKITEGADCYIIGSILPVCAALMGQAVWLPWGGRSLHCNLYAMLAGKPGDRKSSTIDLASRNHCPKVPTTGSILTKDVQSGNPL